MIVKARSIRILAFARLPLPFDGLRWCYEEQGVLRRQEHLADLRRRFKGLDAKALEFFGAGYLRHAPRYDTETVAYPNDPLVFAVTTHKGDCLFEAMVAAAIRERSEQWWRTAAQAYYAHFQNQDANLREAALEIADCHTPETAAATSVPHREAGVYTDQGEDVKVAKGADR